MSICEDAVNIVISNEWCRRCRRHPYAAGIERFSVHPFTTNTCGAKYTYALTDGWKCALHVRKDVRTLWGKIASHRFVRTVPLHYYIEPPFRGPCRFCGSAFFPSRCAHGVFSESDQSVIRSQELCRVCQTSRRAAVQSRKPRKVCHSVWFFGWLEITTCPIMFIYYCYSRLHAYGKHMLVFCVRFEHICIMHVERSSMLIAQLFDNIILYICSVRIH